MAFDDPTLLPSTLTWTEVDPARHPFDPDGVAAVVRSLPPAADVPSYPLAPDLGSFEWDLGYPWTEAMTASLIGHYGRWASGWRWNSGEGELDGGPVHSWCCAMHSMHDPVTTLRRVGESLLEWRQWLEE